MSLYLVERSDKCGYDEYDAFVVRALSEEEAQQIAYEASYPGRPELRNAGFLNGKVIKIATTGKSGVILGSFNAG